MARASTIAQRITVPEGAQAALGGELRECRRLMVALVREPLDRFLREDVRTAVHPERHLAALAEPVDSVVVVHVDEANRTVGVDSSPEVLLS